ncbi:gap junction Cx32.2 protein-like isoform 1-T4 [Clarias gariepinus]|uniref:gap junction Cx32.2 protein-like n=1 Tax=Clarias gariepinus TaxID=13013 RepID=UPI00234CCA82|nr:gap junction Cx32.2 protein-like [Clarias gariepinus]XP_053345072.1 gap junction Cx32.2 protein-like [Clarias gariepinus]XP_053345073.1 gap junction Cx32.2 protein-like [Clarias gariepinus]XP_053345074.1 gap junction Cx32.2 protein-like [Clarias gariepinus]
MQDWGFLFMVLDKVQSNSTVIGKIWIRALFIFRILILGTAAAIVWEDERSSLECNTRQPGCENVCYDLKFPISQIRFWIVQVIFVSMPTILYLCHVLHVVHQKNKVRERVRHQHDNQVTNISNNPDEGRVECNLFISYLTHLFFKIILELAFIIGQYYLYDFFMGHMFTCNSSPCPNSVECYMSRPTEKNIFNVLMLAVACVSLLLNVIEAVYLMCSRARCCSGNNTENPASLHSSCKLI